MRIPILVVSRYRRAEPCGRMVTRENETTEELKCVSKEDINREIPNTEKPSSNEKIKSVDWNALTIEFNREKINLSSGLECNFQQTKSGKTATEQNYIRRQNVTTGAVSKRKLPPIILEKLRNKKSAVPNITWIRERKRVSNESMSEMFDNVETRIE